VLETVGDPAAVDVDTSVAALAIDNRAGVGHETELPELVNGEIAIEVARTATSPSGQLQPDRSLEQHTCASATGASRSAIWCTF